jgi:polyphosphate kinase 2 (PPK2 family)
MDSLDEELENEFEDVGSTNKDANSAKAIEFRRFYFRELIKLQGELVKLQDWVVANKHRMVIIFEGRDAAGKGGVIKRITQRLNPRICRVAALPAPNDRESNPMVFSALRLTPTRCRRNRSF